ncbi:MAG: hypothetical protein ACJAUC_000348 [Planctomycetota bacterium]|jgi:hypothetical protein
MLKVVWTYPVYKPTTPRRKPGQRTVAKEVDRALPIEQAYMLVADGDKRPLLIMRECELCKGTDHAVLSRTLSNEQTVLLTHWFRCVKLPPNVLTEKHPFFNLFKKGEKQKKVPHLFFADPNGDNKIALPGDQSQSELWKVMFTYLDRCYDENAKAAIKQLRKVLGSYDKLDAEEQLIRSRIDKEIEKNGPKSKKLKRFDKDLAKVAVQREKLRAKEKELRDLALKAPVEPKPETANQQ